MTQIIYRATTATSMAAGDVITTNHVHLLPQWAPPIEYIGTTDPWFALFLIGTTVNINGVAEQPGTIQVAKVRAYGRRATLHDGRECFGTEVTVAQQYGSQTATITGGGRPHIQYVLTYRAVGELTRP